MLVIFCGFTDVFDFAILMKQMLVILCGYVQFVMLVVYVWSFRKFVADIPVMLFQIQKADNAFKSNDSGLLSSGLHHSW
jgi:hypothetical protein